MLKAFRRRTPVKQACLVSMLLVSCSPTSHRSLLHLRPHRGGKAGAKVEGPQQTTKHLDNFF